jgi:hypothetical protein
MTTLMESKMPIAGGPDSIRRAVLAAVAVALCLTALPNLGGAAAHAPASTAAPLHASSLLNEPGYKPLVDPESSAVALGRRVNAPLVALPFTGGAKSLDDLGRAVCGALHAGSRDSLMKLCVTDKEFRVILWREFPQSRPVTGVHWDDAWKILYARLHAGCSQAVRDNGGHWYEFVRFESDSVSHFRNFTLHSGLVLVAKDDTGGQQRWRWLRSVAERKGSFKIYSTDD